jgi:acetoin utilization deacetylase AcuC-like enzyme
MSRTQHLVKALSDAIPLGPHPDPHAEWIRVRLDIVQQTVDHLDWLEKGNAEWRQMALQNSNYAEAARATARVAISHLQAILQPPRRGAQRAGAHPDTPGHTAARDWLQSIGAE